MMKAILFMLAVSGLVSGVSALPPTPVLRWSASMHDYLLINNTMRQSMYYTLAMDAEKLLWRRDDAFGGGTTRSNIYNNATLATSFADANGNMLNCTYHSVPPATPASMPFEFLIIDSTATDIGAKTLHGTIKTNDWRHLRPPSHSGPFNIPAEDMNWFLRTDNNAVQLTSCIQHYGQHPGDGGNSTTSNGSRDYTKAWTSSVPASTFATPKGCRPAASASTDAVERLWPAWARRH